MRKRTVPLLALLVVFAAMFILVASVFAKGDLYDRQGRFKVQVLALTTFGGTDWGESGPWFLHETWPLQFDIKGGFSPVYCQLNGKCFTITGTGKTNSGPSLMAIMLSDKLNMDSAYFVTSAISGTRADPGKEGFQGTLGFVGIANWIVDGDFGTHFDRLDLTKRDPADVQKYAWYFLSDYDNAQFHLNEALTQKAYALTKNVLLADDAEAQAARAMYPTQKGMVPFVAICDTVSMDNFFSGDHDADKVDHIVRYRSGGAATKCTSQFEDAGYANVLARFGMLDRLVIVRSASDFETQAPGQSAYELLTSGYPGYAISTENAYRVATVIANYLVTRP